MIVNLGDGLRTTVHVAEYAISEFELRVVRLPSATTLAEWCARESVEEALVGGFYLREPQRPADPLHSGMPLGHLRTGGRPRDSVPFDDPWGDRRACVHSDRGEVKIGRRDELPELLEGDLLQAGPLLVADGAAARFEAEGFSEGSGQFDSDITIGRHPRAALGIGDGRMIAVASEGRTATEAGLTIPELTEVMIGLGAHSALNLDGGGSTSMINAGRLRNAPREGDGTEIPGGRPIATGLAFLLR